MNPATVVTMLKSMHANAISMAAMCDALIKELSEPTPPPAAQDTDGDPCASGNHPADQTIAAPVMGKPSRRLCKKCRQLYGGEEVSNA